ncbi:E3 ubiquitin-protein ligase RHA1B-like [Hevea brasiliensis]|nr:E3 ubiquitin-protein ligase RHA1B-like [Hevea brasiliensis]
MPKLTLHDLLLTLPALINLTLLAATSFLHQFIELFQNYRANSNHRDYVEEAEENRPSPSMVPVPFISHVVSKLIKKKLPVIQFREFQSRMQACDDEDSASCAICLSCIEIEEEIRLLANCRHVYHRECLDGWVEHGHGTCPLCRTKLLPAQAAEIDPQREERIAYLFGEDYVFDSF